MNTFTQDDAFELFGCGATASRVAAWRRVFRLAPGRVQKLLEIKAKRRAELEAEYARGYEDGRCEALGFEVK